MKFNLFVFFLMIFGNCSECISQCEDLINYTDPKLIESWNGTLPNWKDLYYEHVFADSNTVFIKSDSVLVSYMAHPKNSTNYGMPCSFYLATNFALNEMDVYIEKLYKNLGRVDSSNFQKSQSTWLNFFNQEWDFTSHAFVGYANYSKYGHGREIMIVRTSDRYKAIKDRILTIKYYIRLSEYYEETNDD